MNAVRKVTVTPGQRRAGRDSHLVETAGHEEKA